MTALIWLLIWLPQVLSAMSELPQPVNLTLTSSHFIYMFKWQPGPGTPTGVYYNVTINTDKGTSWLPVAGCAHVQRPLVCNLTDAFSDPRQVYLVQVTALLKAQTSQPAIYPDFIPLRDTQLDLPLLRVTTCGRDLCVDLQPPMEHRRELYESLSYKLKIESDSAHRAQDTKSLKRQILEDLAPGRQYCVSVRIFDSLESKESNYSQPVCAFTSGIYTADKWISAVFCLLVMFGVVIGGLLVFTGFICLKRRPQPLVLTSIHHIERVLIIAPCSTSLSSLMNVKPTLHSSGEKRSNQSLSDESDGESGTEGTVIGISLPAPSNVSISSFNMEHSVSFLPGPGTPSDTHFTVQIVCHRKNWRPVVDCLELTAGQICNLTRVFKDPYTQYKARVQAFTPTQTSNWTVSAWFQPLTDTVLGPPDVSVSGCGNCLILQLRVPATRGLQQNLQLKSLYRGVIFHVQRTRDGAQFRLNLPYNEENVITYLQPGVEYCVTVSVTALLNSNPVSSKPYCAFTSRPPPRSSLYMVFGLLGAFCMMGILRIGLVVYGGQLSFKLLRQHLSRTLS
ncbi:cytokine receptor family member b2 isoform X2 [Xiphias gladius]|uniref:cytokine receptor family member b2 isoform X2 n=1 Tax=Xiphias gladius TaxID=8245 RepID=UPI001A986444|nr:cytokine receptor family member b2 isoform X2 [Xiphias gladius]